MRFKKNEVAEEVRTLRGAKGRPETLKGAKARPVGPVLLAF